MENKIIARKFRLLSQLMELHEENPFKIKSIANAAFKLDKLPFHIVDQTEEELSLQQGIGKSTAAKVWELIHNGTIRELEELLAKTPEGILAMLSIKGIGPKKINVIWRTLGIENLGELYYACNENRLIEAKGFGYKTQEEIKRAIEFTLANKGFFLYAQAEKLAEEIHEQLQHTLPKNTLYAFTGDYRRKLETLSTVDFLVALDASSLHPMLKTLKGLLDFDVQKERIDMVHETGLTFRFFCSTADRFYNDLWLTTGSQSHLEQLQLPADLERSSFSNEEAIYNAFGLDYIEPELREGLEEIALAKAGRLPKLITYSDIKGALHNHSTWSDGVHSLEQMARHCKEELHLSYLGICDHSRTAVYANGLSIERIAQQWLEIDQLNRQLAPFRIFKGIESDILSDGALDYPDELLQGFDFVVASIHANLKMDEEKATKRIIKAIENPYTTILGHPTGRLLLSRKGYPIDYKKVIDACAANQVVIEINANPLRLDLDWRWQHYALEKGVILSINPDAHRMEGLQDMRYGVYAARKGGLSATQCLNCMDLDAITSYFNQRKATSLIQR